MDRIEIIIQRKQAEARKHRQRHAPKDIGSRRRQNDPLPRRLRKGGLINFYDMGQVPDGSGGWITKPFSSPRPYDGSYLGAVFDDNVYHNLVADLLSSGTSALLTDSRRIEYTHGEYFDIAVYGDTFDIRTHLTEPHWTEQGMSLTPEQLSDPTLTIGWKSYIFGEPHDPKDEMTLQEPYFTQFRPNDTEHFKVTSAFDYGASRVAFAPKADDTYFLCPKVMTVQSLSGVENKPAGGSASNLDSVSTAFFDTLTPRLLPNGYPQGIIGGDYLTIAEWEANVTLAASRNPGFFLLFTENTSGISTMISAAQYLAMTPILYAPGLNWYLFYIGSEQVWNDGYPFTLFYGIHEGLCAVVKQGGSYFYIWKV